MWSTDGFVVRLAGLPVVVLAGLRSGESASIVESLVASERWLAAEGEVLSDLLHPVIAVDRHRGDKPRLVGLRRAVHGVRSPDPSEWNPSVARLLPPETAEQVCGWLDRLRQHRHDRERLALVLAEEAVRQVDLLRDIVTDPGFRRALWQSSRMLSAELDKWLADPDRRPRQRLLRRLAKYVSRAATKTSPYSTFTISGFGRWTDTGPAIRLTQGLEPRGVTEISGRIRDRLVQALAAQPALWDSLVARVNPSATICDGQVSFLGHPPAEPVATVPATPALRECLRLAAGEQVTLGGLRDRLAADRGGTAPGTLTRFLTHLVDVGLLEAGPPLAAGAAGFGVLSHWLAGHAANGFSDVAQLLAGVEVRLGESAPVADVPGHRDRQRELGEAVKTLLSRIGAPSPPTVTGPSAVLDNAVLTTNAGTCARSVWRPALADLDRIRRWLAVFEPALPLKLALADLVGGRLRPAERLPFLVLYRTVLAELASGSTAGTEIRRLMSAPADEATLLASRLPRLRELPDLQVAALQPLRRPPGEDGVVRVDSRVLARLAAARPGWVGSLHSIGCYVQPLVSAGRCELVLNSVATGVGRGRSRMAHLVARAGGPQPPPDRPGPASADSGPALAELGGEFGSSLNERSPSLAYEVEYPFTTTGRAAAERLPLNDLTVGHDPGRGRLRLYSTRLGREVRVFHLGGMAEQLLPPAARLVVRLFGEVATIRPDLLFLFHRPVEYDPARQVQHVPRVVAGRVVVRRACWTITDIDPVRRPTGEPDAGYLLRLNRWRDSAGVPARCFVRAFPPDSNAEPGGWQRSKARKPVYIDFASWLLVGVFEQMVRRATFVVFEEALPDPERAVEPGGAPRVVELLVEIGEREARDA